MDYIKTFSMQLTWAKDTIHGKSNKENEEGWASLLKAEPLLDSLFPTTTAEYFFLKLKTDNTVHYSSFFPLKPAQPLKLALN